MDPIETKKEEREPEPTMIPTASAPIAPKISYEDFAKIEIKTGKIISAEKVPETDKLLRLSVDFAEGTSRTIVSGIAMYFPDPATLIGRTCMFVTNLEPRTIKGIESNGMLFALSTTEAFSLLEPVNIPPGTRAK